jgi:hypothetical protein
MNITRIIITIFIVIIIFIVYIVFIIQKNDVQGVDPHGVVSYINDVSKEEKYNYLHGNVTGIKGECVEYARRWMMIVNGVTFESVDNAYDLWNTTHVSLLSDQTIKYKFINYPIHSHNKPTVGSLVIYRKTNKYPYGHVAVIVGVHENGEVDIAEQNQSCDKWENNYSRRIYLDEEPDVIGLKKIKNN